MRFLAISAFINTATFSATIDGSRLKLLDFSSPIVSPSGAVFLSKTDALVTQKNDGRVLFIENGKTVHTALNLAVANRGSQGLLDIALSPRFSKDRLVYLYLTPSLRDGDYSGSKVINRYEWDDLSGKLIFDKTVLALPKAKKEYSASGLIRFDSKGQPAIAPQSSVGPNYTSMAFQFSKGASGTMTVIHPGLTTLNPKAIGLMPAALHQKGSGALSLTTTTTLGNVKVAPASGTISLGSTGIIASHSPISGTLITAEPMPLFSAGGITTINHGALPLPLVSGSGTFTNAALAANSGMLTLTQPITGAGMLTIDVVPRGDISAGTNDLIQVQGTSNGALDDSRLSFGSLALNGMVLNGDLSYAPPVPVTNVGTTLTGAASAFRNSFLLNDLGRIVSSGTIDLIHTGTITLNGGTNVINHALDGGTLTLTDGPTVSFGTIGLAAATIDLSSGISEMSIGTPIAPNLADPQSGESSPSIPAGELPLSPLAMPASLNSANTPEPSTGLLLMSAAAGMSARRRRIRPK